MEHLTVQGLTVSVGIQKEVKEHLTFKKLKDCGWYNEYYIVQKWMLQQVITIVSIHQKTLTHHRY